VDQDAMLQRAVEAARAGARVLLRRYRSDLKRTGRGPLDFVTDADLESEVVIVARLRRSFPNHGIYSEESGWVQGGPESGYQWLVDPLCGTVNYAAGFPMFCVNLALVHQRRPVLGVMVQPLARMHLYCDAGQPTYVLVQGRDPAAAATNAESRIVALDFAKPLDDAYINETLNLALHSDFGMEFLPRSIGSSVALGYVARGRMAAFIAFSTGDVHFAAGAALVRGAGGVVTDLEGAEWMAGAKGIVAAADKATHLLLIAMVRASLRRNQPPLP
jgi:myo-inositol-1(or 4)-monophosphatase